MSEIVSRFKILRYFSST